VHALSEHKCDDSKGTFNEELEQVFGHFSSYYTKILLRVLIQEWEERIL